MPSSPWWLTASLAVLVCCCVVVFELSPFANGYTLSAKPDTYDHSLGWPFTYMVNQGTYPTEVKYGLYGFGPFLDDPPTLYFSPTFLVADILLASVVACISIVFVRSLVLHASKQSHWIAMAITLSAFLLTLLLIATAIYLLSIKPASVPVTFWPWAFLMVTASIVSYVAIASALTQLTAWTLSPGTTVCISIATVLECTLVALWISFGLNDLWLSLLPAPQALTLTIVAWGLLLGVISVWRRCTPSSQPPRVRLPKVWRVHRLSLTTFLVVASVAVWASLVDWHAFVYASSTTQSGAIALDGRGWPRTFEVAYDGPPETRQALVASGFWTESFSVQDLLFDSLFLLFSLLCAFIVLEQVAQRIDGNDWKLRFQHLFAVCFAVSAILALPGLEAHLIHWPNWFVHVATLFCAGCGALVLFNLAVDGVRACGNLYTLSSDSSGI